MIGKEKTQLSLLDSVFNARTKKSRTDWMLKQIDEWVDWKSLERICQPAYAHGIGRPSIPIVVAIKCLILQYLYDLSDPELEDALIDRLSFQRFTRLTFDRDIPDYSTIWRFRERLIKAGLHKALFDAILRQLDKKGYVVRKGTIVDATLVEAARKKRTRPEDEAESPQQDVEATATKRGNTVYYGYKGHIGMDQESGIIREVSFTTASVHDSQEFTNLLSGDERAIFGDKGYANDEVKRECRRTGIYYGILDKGRRGRPNLSPRQKRRNRIKSKIRSAVERPFAHFKHLMGYTVSRYVTMARNGFHFISLCMIENIRRGISIAGLHG